jgi:hypothetical protein
MRARASAPRIATFAAIGVLSLAGVRQIVAPPHPITITRQVLVPDSTNEAAADAFAESFARTYLTFSGVDTTSHDNAVASYLAPGVDLGQSVVPSTSISQHVTWTAVAGNSPEGEGKVTITVAVALDTDAVLRYLAIPVAEGAGGTLAVTALPAFVGPPPLDSNGAPSDGEDVSDAGLRAVVARALASYLRGDNNALAADVVPGVSIPVPAAPLTLTQTQAITQATAGQLIVLLSAHDAYGVTYSLRYQVAVVLRDRWYVAAIDPPKGAP